MSDRIALFMTLALVGMLAVPAAQAGPFPAGDSMNAFVATAAEDAERSRAHTVAITSAAWEATATAINRAQSLDAVGGMEAMEGFFDEVGPSGAGVVDAGRNTIVAGIGSAGDQFFVGVTYGEYLSLLAQERTGVRANGGVPPDASRGSTPCVGGSVEILQQVIDLLPPGGDVPVCAGTYTGDLRIGTEFLTLRAAQGPFATVIDGTITIEATGVSVSGFTLTGGGVVVGGEGDGYTGEIWGTLIHGNRLQGNDVAVRVGHAVGTLVIGNTLRANNAGVVAEAIKAESLSAEAAAGVILVGNDLERNGRYAVRTDDLGIPVISIGDHYGAVAPQIGLANGLCAGAGLTDTRCRNAAGPGVVVVAASPVAHDGL